MVVATSKRSPRNQVFLVFSDGTRFEFWGDNFSCCGGLDDGKTIQRYVDSNHGEIVRVYDEAPISTRDEAAQNVLASPDTLMERMKQDLEAWELAKAVIATAKG